MKTALPSALFACLLVIFFPARAQDATFGSESARSPLIRSSVLPVEEAFAMNAFVEAPDTIVLLWEIREGYYLYQKSLKLENPEGRAVAIDALPEGDMIMDEFFGDVTVYYDRLLLRMPFAALSGTGNLAAFTVYFQGCAQDKYCYPMQIREIELTLP